GVGGTGVVATLRRGTSNRCIALRAEMDALRITEQTNLPYASRNTGTMHACGHDGHTTMLLGAARRLVAEGDFDGTVRFVFQPAEEWGKGALAMLADGLMDRFPFEEIYGLHNLPGVPVGTMQARPGAMMSAEDNFVIKLRGKGGHAARPHWGRETLVAGAALVMQLQTIVSRRINPTDTAVVSVTEFNTDGIRNALPGLTVLKGDARSFSPEVSTRLEAEMRMIAAGTALTYDVDVEVDYTHEFLPLMNDRELVEEAMEAGRGVFGEDGVRLAEAPQTSSEDFAQLLSKVPGCFSFIGNGEKSFPLHNSSYDFNDDVLPYGANYHVAIARRRLPV
nr:amidohydrolase [Pseudomonadota bacterium]